MELLEVKAGAKAKAGASPEVHSCILAKKKKKTTTFFCGYNL